MTRHFLTLVAVVGVILLRPSIVVAASASPNPSVNSSPRGYIATEASIPAFCSDPPRDSCAFYSDCLESQYHCGPDGYPIGYGGYFCNKFQATRPKFSPQGQKWVLDVMQCLQRALVPYAETTTYATCSSISDTAYASHSGCYVETGFCKLPPGDWLEVMGILLPDKKFWTVTDILTGLKTEAECTGAYQFISGLLSG